MLKRIRKIPPKILYGILLFIFFAFVFSFFRLQIYNINAWCFAMTGEIQQIQFTSAGELKLEGEEEKTALPFTDKKPAVQAAAATTATKSTASESAPVKAKLPLTEQPRILFVNTVTEQDLQKSPLFPALRVFNGTEWKKEKTEVRMASDGETLKVSFLCFDAEPAKIVTEHSENEGASFAWKDDSIEFFLIKNPKSDHYFQYVCSASGISKVYYYKATENPRMGGNENSFPKDFKKPIIRGEKCDEGYRIYMEIAMSNNLDMPKLGVGKDIYLQIVRNYRGQNTGTNLETALQLYPTYIYADSSTGAANNHDRRAFQPAKLATE